MVDYSFLTHVCTFRLSTFGYPKNKDIPDDSHHIVIIRWHQKTFSFSRVFSEARRLPFPSVFGWWYGILSIYLATDQTLNLPTDRPRTGPDECAIYHWFVRPFRGSFPPEVRQMIRELAFRPSLWAGVDQSADGLRIWAAGDAAPRVRVVNEEKV